MWLMMLVGTVCLYHKGRTAQLTTRRDTTPPSLVFTGPISGATIPFLPWVGGWVRDNTGGSGVARVQVQIKRRTNGRTFYWSGYQWETSRAALHRFVTEQPDLGVFWLGARIQGSRWTYEWLPTRYVQIGGGGVPQIGPRLFPGVYTFTATAYDHEGNAHSVAHRVTVAPDTTLPHVGFTRPARHTVAQRLPVAEGWAWDKGGSGLERVTVVLSCLRYRRYRGKETWYWARGAWQPTNNGRFIEQPATVAGNRWRWNASLPHGKDLPPGTYTFWVFAYDRAGNRNGLRYTQFPAPPGGDSSGVDVVNVTRQVVIKAP